MENKNHELDEQLISWEILEHEHVQKTLGWYWLAGLIIVGAVIISIVLNNFLFAIVILIGGGLLIFFAYTHPRLIHITITSAGIDMDGKFYDYKILHSFSILHKTQKNEYRLLVLTGDKIKNIINVPIDGDNVNPHHLQEVLEEFVEYNEELRETFSDQIAEKLGF